MDTFFTFILIWKHLLDSSLIGSKHINISGILWCIKFFRIKYLCYLPGTNSSMSLIIQLHLDHIWFVQITSGMVSRKGKGGEKNIHDSSQHVTAGQWSDRVREESVKAKLELHNMEEEKRDPQWQYFDVIWPRGKSLNNAVFSQSVERLRSKFSKLYSV